MPSRFCLILSYLGEVHFDGIKSNHQTKINPFTIQILITFIIIVFIIFVSIIFKIIIFMIKMGPSSPPHTFASLMPLIYTMYIIHSTPLIHSRLLIHSHFLIHSRLLIHSPHLYIQLPSYICRPFTIKYIQQVIHLPPFIHLAVAKTRLRSHHHQDQDYQD